MDSGEACLLAPTPVYENSKSIGQPISSFEGSVQCENTIILDGAKELDVKEESSGATNNLETCLSTSTPEYENQIGIGQPVNFFLLEEAKEPDVKDESSGATNNLETCLCTPTPEYENQIGIGQPVNFFILEEAKEPDVKDESSGATNNLETCLCTSTPEYENQIGIDQPVNFFKDAKEPVVKEEPSGATNNLETCLRTPSHEYENQKLTKSFESSVQYKNVVTLDEIKGPTEKGKVRSALAELELCSWAPTTEYQNQMCTGQPVNSLKNGVQYEDAVKLDEENEPVEKEKPGNASNCFEISACSPAHAQGNENWNGNEISHEVKQSAEKEIHDEAEMETEL